MQRTHNALPENIRVQSVELLNRNLAASIDLQAQAKQAHWNVRGPGFVALHTLFDAVAGSLAAFGQSVREASSLAAGFGEAATADLFTEVSRKVDSQLWLVESHRSPS